MFEIRKEELVSKTDKLLYNIQEILGEILCLMRKDTEEPVNRVRETPPTPSLPTSFEAEFIGEEKPKKPRKPRGTPAKKRRKSNAHTSSGKGADDR